jgi:ribosomal protein S27AE
MLVLLVGVAFGGYGIISIVANQPEKFDSSKSQMTLLGRNGIGNWLDVQARNSERAQRRASGATMVGVGTIVLLIGLVVTTLSGRGSMAEGHEAPASVPAGAVRAMRYCTRCGAGVSQPEARFCASCGAAVVAGRDAPT